MKSAVIIALVLIGGGVLAQLLLADPGYVAIRAGGSLFETTVPVFIVLLLGLYLLIRALLQMLTVRRRLAHWRARRRTRKARRDTQQGLLDLAAGNWKTAEDLLSRSAPDADSAAANYLGAARAADLLGAVDRRDEWVNRAREHAPDQRAPAMITLAEMQMRRGQDLAALQTLEQLDASGDMNSRGLGLLARLYQRLGENDKLRELGPRLKADKSLPDEQVVQLLAHAQLAEVRAAGERGDRSAVDKAWSEVPRSSRKLPQSAVAHARALIGCDDHAAAEKILREVIETNGDNSALRLYGDLVLAKPLLALERAETWLERHPENPELLATCARLCLHAELIGKALTYLEASIARRPNAENSLLLAELLDQIGERDRAGKVLREELTRAAGRRPSLPRVRLRRGRS
jgi:HemY protein